MSVSMAKTPNHTTGKAISTKVPFKKVFSSSHLQTNGINGGQVNEHKSHRGRCSNDFGTMAHANLSSQLSSSLPGILDNVNSSQPRRATGSMEKGASARSSQKSTNSASSSNAVIESLSKGSVLRTGQNIPFSAIEPSMIVSLSTYLNSLNNFDSEKLVKEIQLMLTYFEDVVKKDKLEQLVGSSTILMETVDANCLKLKNAYLQLQQVQLRLQLLMQSFNMDDDSDTLAKIRSSPVIEANNDLYRNLSELIQWSDQVSVMHNLIENGDRMIPTNGESCSPEQATHVPEPARPSTQENVKMAQTVSHNLLQSFKNLVKAYKNMETELRHCYDDCLHANKQMADLILAENTSANRSLNSMRRRSITPPPDYSLSSSGVTHRVPNGSTSTIASSTSSSSSTSSHFLGRHRFFPNLTNHAQKMAHHFEKKLLNKTNKKDTSPVSGKNASDNVTDKHSWSLWPLLGSSNNLKRSESASDISSIPRNSYLDIPAENSGQTQRGKRSPSPFRKHSVNELGNTKSPDCLTLPNTPIKLNSPNRKSSASQVNRHSDGNESRPMNAPFVAPPKEMLFNPLYFTPHPQSLSPDNSTPNAQPVPGLVTSPSSSPSSTHSKYSIRDELSSNTVECDRPPPLPPKTYQSRSMSSTRSSIASNTSSSSSSSKDCQRFPLKDTDSGLGTMPASSCDLETRNVLKCCANHGPRQNFPACMHVCGHRPAMYNQEILSPSHSTCSFHDSWQHTHHHCGCLAASSASNAEMSQVTLRPKKNRGRTQKCDHERSASPPPLPPPDSILFSLDSVDSIGKDSHPSHCCHSRSCVDERNKENYNCNSPCHCTQHNTTFGQCSNICPQHSTPPTCTCQSRRHVRTYRREHKTQSMAFTKSVRSYSIAESSTSTLKSSLTSTSLTVDCSNSMSHSTSFPQRLSSCDSQPPPLPPKRRNMHAYMVVVGNYSGPIDTSDLFRYTSSNFTKSMIETKTLHAIRQNSTSSSVMSLSSSASSSSSLCTSASSPNNAITVTADHLDKQQYLHLPIAPPPPTNEGTSPDKSLTPPPPRLPPRRDKLNELPIAPPPPPLVSSSSVIQQRMQQAQNNFSEQALLIAPRSSTPVKQSEPCSCLRSPSIEQPEESLGFVEEEEVIEEMAEEELEPDEELPMMVVEEDKPSGFCVYCSEGTVHEEEECVLSQTDVPGRLLTPKTQEDEDDLGDLAIRAGTIDALVVKATQANATGADATFLYTFLTTYRSFLRPDQLINKLIFRYNQFTTKIERTDIVRQSVASKVAKFIVLVVTEFYLYDFSKSLAQTLMDFIYQLVGRGDLAHAKCLREKCFEKLRQRDREISAATNKLTTYNVITRTATLLDFKSEHIAEQMTLLDAGLFHKIEIPEIMIWAKEQKEELIPNLSRFTEHFNKMSFWTRSQILSCEEHKEREKYVLKFLKIMKHLRKLNNFNSYLAILSALGSASISRLDWQKNITEAMRESHALIDSSSSFRTYRTVLAMTKPPCIPYIGLILQDLTFVHIGNSDYMPDGKVNFAKHFKQFSILSQMKQFQQCKYSINENEQIISFFDNFDNYLQEEVMWQISESIKPRGGGNNSMNTNASS